MTGNQHKMMTMTKTDQSREPIIDNSKRFNRQKRELRMVYKQWKAGMLRESDLSPWLRQLLASYYGVRFTRKRT